MSRIYSTHGVLFIKKNSTIKITMNNANNVVSQKVDSSLETQLHSLILYFTIFYQYEKRIMMVLCNLNQRLRIFTLPLTRSQISAKAYTFPQRMACFKLRTIPNARFLPFTAATMNVAWG